MNKRRNAMLIASAAIGIGLVMILASLALTGFDFRKLGTSETKTENYEFTESFTKIEIAAVSSDVRFARSTDGKAHIESVHSVALKEDVGVQNGVLRLEQNGEGGVKFFVWNFGDNERMTVYLPQAEYEALTVATASGDVDVPEELSFTDATLATASGDVRFRARCAGNMTVSTVSGRIEAGDMELRRLDLATTSGDIELKSLRASEKLAIHTVSGDVALDRCDGGEIDLKTTSGEIEGTLLTGKVFEVHTTSGKVKVPSDTAGAPLCTIHTVSGDVKLHVR